MATKVGNTSRRRHTVCRNHFVDDIDDEFSPGLIMEIILTVAFATYVAIIVFFVFRIAEFLYGMAKWLI